MALSIADQYFIKAHEEYHYSMESTIENLNYALSYDPDHADANYLMGNVLALEFSRLEEAEEYYLAALAAEPRHRNTCMSYGNLLLRLARYTELRKLLDFIHTLKGMDAVAVWLLEGKMHEKQEAYEESLRCYRKAMLACLEVHAEEGIAQAEERVLRKIRMMSPVTYGD